MREMSGWNRNVNAPLVGGGWAVAHRNSSPAGDQTACSPQAFHAMPFAQATARMDPCTIFAGSAVEAFCGGFRAG